MFGIQAKTIIKLETNIVTYYYLAQYAPFYHPEMRILQMETSRDYEKERHMKFIMLVALAVLLFPVSHACAAEGKITKMAREAGFTSCISTVARLEGFLSGKQNYGSWSFWSNQETDRQPFNASMEVSYSDGGILVDFTVIPSPDGTCIYTYTKSWYTPNSCQKTLKQKFMQKAVLKGKLNVHVQAYSLETAEVLLQKAGSGCMVQKKEVGFQFTRQQP